MEDKLAQEIRSKQQMLSKLLAEVDELEKEIAILERAASLRPMPAQNSLMPNKPQSREEPSRRGKPSGSISMNWRTVLNALYPRRVSVNDIIQMASEHGVKVTEAAVRDRLKYLAEHNYMIGNDLHGYEVTEQAVKRFGFAQKR